MWPLRNNLSPAVRSSFLDALHQEPAVGRTQVRAQEQLTAAQNRLISHIVTRFRDAEHASIHPILEVHSLPLHRAAPNKQIARIGFVVGHRAEVKAQVWVNAKI